VRLCFDNGSLREEDSEDFIVCSVDMVVIRSSHRLFSHLALIHVPRTLVVVGKGSTTSHDREDVDRVNLLMSCVWSNVFFLTSNRHVDLFQRAYPLNASFTQVVHSPCESSRSREEEYSWPHHIVVIILMSLCRGNVSNF
jgi:hypothetical protein